MLKFFVLAAVFALCSGQPVQIKYPPLDPCLLIDIDADISLVWTNSEGQQEKIPSFTLSDASTLSGICESQSPSPAVTLRLGVGGTFSFYFINSSDTVQYTWRLLYSPDTVYKNGLQGTVTHSGTFGTGPADFAFACSNVPDVNNTKPAVGMNKYQVLINIKSFKAQGFGVTSGTYSEESRCPADGVNTEQTTEPTQTTKPTTKPTEPSTEPTTVTTEPTTKPAEPTTEPAEPTTATTEPTTKPTEPTTVTTEPTTNSTETTETTRPTTATTNTMATTKPTTPKPSPTTPAPAPSQHAKETFEVFADDVQCVLMEGEFLFSLVYPKKDNTNGTASIGVQEVKSVSGDCNATGGDENVVTVMFYDDWVMDLTISKKPSSVGLGAEDSNKYYWSRLTLQYSYDTKLGNTSLFPNANTTVKAPLLNVTLPDGTYEASTGGSYLCNVNQNIDLGGGNSLQTWNLHYDAFATTNHTSFTDKNLTECNDDSKTSSVVPIAVGAALAGLVVIVLIAYLIGRRRNRKGYESV